MQTLIVNARCICQEKQGILVQGYVQWAIDDFNIAYKQLDFSDPIDPLRVVNTQLSEQAEAVIKDTVASMTLENVLADRQPIIKELTQRLRSLMEGEDGSGGLGLKIVTVQIKEAIVSSATLWETLQRPFRAERAQLAKIAELTQEAVIHEQEHQQRKTMESQRIKLESELTQLRCETEAKDFDRDRQETIRREILNVEAEAESFNRQQQEEVRRAKIEAENVISSLEFERQKEAAQAELELLKTENKLKVNQHTFEHQDKQRQAEILTQRLEHQIDNDLSPERIKQILIENMADIVRELPKPTELKSISFEGGDIIGHTVPALMKLIDRLSESTLQTAKPPLPSDKD